MKTNKKPINRALSVTDIKEIRNQCKMGISLSFLVFILTSIVGVTIYESVFDLNPNGLNTEMTIAITAGALILSVVLNLLINHKYYQDLKIREKIRVVKILTSKCKTNDYAAGGRCMTNTFNERYEFVVDDIKFSVDKELFERCSEGDTLIFNYALKSRYLLNIEKSKQIR